MSWMSAFCSLGAKIAVQYETTDFSLSDRVPRSPLHRSPVYRSPCRPGVIVVADVAMAAAWLGEEFEHSLYPRAGTLLHIFSRQLA